MTNQEFPQSILDALEKGPFNALSKKEQNEILNHMSETEYTEMHQTISEFRSADLILDQDINTSLSSRMMNTNTSSHHLSWWKAVAAGLFIAVSSFSLGRATVNNDCDENNSDMIFAYQDTIGRSLAEDTIRKSLWCFFDKEML